MQNQMQPPMSPQMPPPFMRRRQAPGTVLDLETGLPPVRLPEITENIGNSVRRLPQIIPERMPSRRPTPRFFGGGLGNIFARLPNQRARERMSPPLPRAPLPMPMPEDMPRERFPMMRPGFAEGEEVRSGMRSGATGPRVQNISKQVLRPPLGGTISAAARGAAMSPISKFGIPGAIAAGGIALYQIADETGMVPEEIGRGAASVQKGFTEVVNEAVDMARDIGAPVMDFVERVKMGYQQGMNEGQVPEPDPREILGEQGRTISNMDRNLMQQEQMFFPQSESLDDILEDLEKKN